MALVLLNCFFFFGYVCLGLEDGSVPEGWEAEGGDPDRREWDSHYKSGADAKLYNICYDSASGLPSILMLSNAWGPD